MSDDPKTLRAERDAARASATLWESLAKQWEAETQRLEGVQVRATEAEAQVRRVRELLGWRARGRVLETVIADLLRDYMDLVDSYNRLWKQTQAPAPTVTGALDDAWTAGT